MAAKEHARVSPPGTVVHGWESACRDLGASMTERQTIPNLLSFGDCTERLGANGGAMPANVMDFVILVGSSCSNRLEVASKTQDTNYT